MKKTIGLKGFFNEIIERFNCSRDVQEKYNKVISKMLEHILVYGKVEIKVNKWK